MWLFQNAKTCFIAASKKTLSLLFHHQNFSYSSCRTSVTSFRSFQKFFKRLYRCVMSKKAKPNVANILCVGPKASGKTMLLRKLEDSSAEVSPIPTVGVNHAEISLENRSYSIREIGSALSETWSTYYASSRAFIFVIDGVNPGKMAINFVMLMDLLAHPHTQRKKVLLLMNKRDMLGHMSAEEIKYTLRLHDIIRESSQDLEVVETSARSCLGFKQIRDWLEKLPDGSK